MFARRRRLDEQPVRAVHPNWWIDDPDPAAAVDVHQGARSVSHWREDFLGDFAERMICCKSFSKLGTTPRRSP
ncbi:MAG: hypothetical protein GY953_29755 [bacterium]|nr:hypothetical protein [bacterium]